MGAVKELTLLMVASWIATASAEPLFFGVSLTDGAGNILGATNPLQTGALAGAGLLTFAGGLAVGNALAQQQRSRTRSRSRGRSYRRRGRRSVEEQDEVLNTDWLENLEVYKSTLSEVYKGLVDDYHHPTCLRRWICEIASDEEAHKRALPILNLARQSEFDQFLSPELEWFKYEGQVAMQVGAKVADEKFCAAIYKCPMSVKEIEQQLPTSGQSVETASLLLNNLQ